VRLEHYRAGFKHLAFVAGAKIFSIHLPDALTVTHGHLRDFGGGTSSQSRTSDIHL
jgi:hypothetical protein